MRKQLFHRLAASQFGKSLALSIALLFVLVQIATPTVHALSQADYDAIYQWPWWNPSASACGVNGVGTTVTGTVGTSASQVAIIKIIIGIAKTDNLGQAGATIGLMVGEDESTFEVYANTNVPVSENVPHTAEEGGPDVADSVGVFQQQPDDDWSTLANGAAALTDQAAVAQNMDPAFSAEAFFGSPVGTTVNAANPGALTHGLMDVSGWQTMDPWVAAQAVQQSGTPDGSNYERFVGLAQNLITQYWDSSPAVPLPVPFTAGGAPGGTTAAEACPTTVNCNSPSGATGNLSTVRQNVVCLAQAELALWTPPNPKLTPGFASFSKYTPCLPGNCLTPGACATGTCSDELWCADFVSYIYYKADYPVQPLPDWRNASVVGLMTIGQQGGNFHWHPAGGYTPKPGDMVIHNQGGEQHVNLVVAVNGNTMTLIGGDQDAPDNDYPNGSNVSTYQDAGFSGVDNITGYVSPD